MSKDMRAGVSWPLPTLNHWEMEMGGTSMERIRGERKLCWNFATVFWSGEDGRHC